MRLDLGQPDPDRPEGATDSTPVRRDPGRALRAALYSGGRRIHIDVTDDGVHLRSRVGGRLREIALLPEETGRTLVALLEDTARGGVGTLELDGGMVTLRYRLAGCEMSSGRSLVLTLLPSSDDMPVENLGSLELPGYVRAELEADLARRRGLILVAGVPGSGRARTLRALAGETDPEQERLLLLAFDKTPPMTMGRHPYMTLDLREEIWSLLERVENLDADRIVVPEIKTPLHATLALAFSGNRRRGLAPIRAQDTAGALVKMRELAADRHRAARDIVGALAQHRLPTPCPECSELHRLAPGEVGEAGWDPVARRQLLARGPGVRSRGHGCGRCSGSGYVGWTYLYEYLSVDDEIASRLRETVDPGKLREELKATMAGRGVLQAGWREVLRGTIELDELDNIPGPEVVPFRIERSSFDDTHSAAAPRDRRDRALRKNNAAEPDLAGTASEVRHRLYRRSYETMRHALATLKSGENLDPEPLEKLAGEIVDTVKPDSDVVLTALTEGDGNNLVVHQINVAVLAVAIGMGLDWNRHRLLRVAVAALLHDAGLLRVPLQVLQKEGPLEPQEEEARRRHAELGESMVRASLPRELWLQRVVRQIHERESGRGYPDGLTGDRIDPVAKAIGLADALEAKTHRRPGRAGAIAFDAIQSLNKDHADEFDRKFFQAMVRRVSLFPVGSRVRLSNGSVARVASINTENFYRPRVEIVRDPSGQRVSAGQFMNLADSPFLHIVEPIREDV